MATSLTMTLDEQVKHAMQVGAAYVNDVVTRASTLHRTRRWYADCLSSLEERDSESAAKVRRTVDNHLIAKLRERDLAIRDWDRAARMVSPPPV